MSKTGPFGPVSRLMLILDRGSVMVLLSLPVTRGVRQVNPLVTGVDPVQ